MRCRLRYILTLAALLLFDHAQAGTPMRIDLGMHTGRSDTAAPGWIEWQVPDGHQATRDFDGVRITLREAVQAGTRRAEGPPAELRGAWNKRFLAAGAPMAADCVTIDRGGLEIHIEGLSPGIHSVATYHNSISDPPRSPYTVRGYGDEDFESPTTQVTPSHEVADDSDVGSAYVEVETGDRWPLIVHITSDSSVPVILNGLEIDAPDPHRKARKPYPRDLDWHADADAGEIELRWTPASGAVKHEVFLAHDADPAQAEAALAAATHDSPEFIGAIVGSSATASIEPNASLRHYRWRVDSIDAQGKVTRGDVWSFRPRHLAFPAAEGYGRFAIGGRGGRVVKVTNLNDAGPGSLRAAIELDEPRTVIFDVSGRIDLKNKLAIRNPYLTIAGQTAPGLGICISNYNLGMLGAHDVIVRYLRVRPGNTSGETLDGMGMASSDHAIIDHCSISWTQDEAFSSRGARNVTLQRTLISEALNIAGHRKYEKGKQHGYAASISGDIGSFHHNLLAHCSGRNWSLAGGLDQASRHAGRLDIRNNVVFNWGHRTTDGGARQVNFVNNYYKPGPTSDVFHVLMAEREAVAAFGPQMYYVAGNVMEGRFAADERYAGVFERRREPRENWTVDQPFFESFVATDSAEDAFHSVLADVGCNVPALDEHDQRVLRETREGTTTYTGSISGLPGLPDTQDDVGGWDDYPEIHRDADWDPDDDGMPSAWEREHGLDPASSVDGNLDADNDGYTNLEEHLHELSQSPYRSEAN